MFTSLVYNVFGLGIVEVFIRTLHVGPASTKPRPLPAGRRFSRQHGSERDNAGYVAAVLSPLKKNRVRKLHGLKAPRVEGCFRRNFPGSGQVVDPELADTSRSTEPKTVTAGFRHPDCQISESDHRAIRSPKSYLFIGSRESAMPRFKHFLAASGTNTEGFPCSE